MRRIWPIAVALVVALMVMAAGVAGFRKLPYLFPKASGQEMLSNWVAENTGGVLTSGYLVPLFYPGLGFQVRDIELKIPDPKGRESTLFSAKALKVVVDRNLLLKHKKLKVRQVILDRPRIFLSRDSAGQWNVSRWLKNRKKQPPPNPEKLGFWRWLIRDSLEDIMPTTDTDLPHLMSSIQLRLNDAEVQIVDGKHKLREPIHLTRVNLDFEGASPARFTLSLPFPQTDGQGGDPLRLSGLIRANSKTDFSLAGLTASWPGLEIRSLAGSLAFKPFRFDARIDTTCSYPAFKRIAMWGPIARSGTIPDTVGSGAGHIQARVWGPEPTRPARMHYQGSATLVNFTWDPGRVIAPIGNVNVTLALNDGEVLLPETSVTIGGMPISGSVRMVEAHNPLFIIDAHADTIDFQRLFKKSRHQDPPGTPMGQMRTRWQGTARLGKAVYGRMHAEAVEGEWQVATDRRLTFPRLQFRACGGSYRESGRSFVDYNHRGEIFFRFDGRARDVDVSTFADQVFNTTTFLHGTFDTEGYITGSFVGGKLSNRSIFGKLPAKVNNGYFAGYNFLGEVFKAFRAQAPAEYQGQHFTRMTATVDLNRGVALFPDLKADGATLKARAQGWIDFPGHTTDIKLEVQLLKPVWGLIKLVPLIGVLTDPLGEAITTMYVRVSGKWGALSYTPFNPLFDHQPPPPPATVDSHGPLPRNAAILEVQPTAAPLSSPRPAGETIFQRWLAPFQKKLNDDN